MGQSRIYYGLAWFIGIATFFNLFREVYAGIQAMVVLGAAITITVLIILGKRSRVRASGAQSRAKAQRVPKSKFPYLEEVAQDLRATARAFEDPRVEVFFVLGGLRIRRTTSSQSFVADAGVELGRAGFRVQFRNVNSRTGKIREIKKRWIDTIGVTPNQFELYLKDHSSIEFIPLDRKTHLYLSVFWQVFKDALNGGDLLLVNPVDSGLGHRLREAAGYIIDNQTEVGPGGAFSLDKVPTRISDEEFFGHKIPSFPELRGKIKRWRLIEKLGAGAFGQVFKVEHIDSGDQAAIKLMSPLGPNKKPLEIGGLMFRNNREHFQDEAALSMKVSSPFVVSAVDSGTEPWPWILYPLVEGTGVREFIAKANDPRSAWWNLAHDLISGLSTIHAEGLVHRDVKPDNMKASKDRFVLLDLGIGEVVGYTGLINGSGASGTFGYIPPDLFLRTEAFDPEPNIDIFAAGMTLLSIFDESELRRIQMAQLSFRESKDRDAYLRFLQQPVDLSRAPAETRTLLGAMTDFDPTKRPSAKQLLKYVADFIDLESKVLLILENRAERDFEPRDGEEEMGEEVPFDFKIRGRQASWRLLEDELHKVIEEIRPRYFIVTINESSDDMVYVQAMSGGGGWHIEAMSEVFAGKPQATETKVNFLRLDWTPPSASEPNYSIDREGIPTAEIIRIFTDAFEFGYGLKPRDIASIEFRGMGRGKY
jgi:serine/threonine protein kinase